MITIHTTPAFSAEKQYVFQVLLHEWLGVPFECRFSNEATHYRLVLPNGAVLLLEDHFFQHLPESGYLHPEQVPEQAATCPNPFDNSPLTIIFGRPEFSWAENQGVCGIDLVASAFFMLSRWEERARPERDQHGRFPAAASLAVRSGFLERPVVHEWAALLRQMLEKLGYHPTPPARTFRLAISCDVDHPRLWWSAADRIKTLGGALLKRRSLPEVADLLRERVFQKKDPYDVFDLWFNIFAQHHLTVQFNFLGKRAPDSDCWYPLEHPFVLQLLQKIQHAGHQIGFHPSYESFGNQAMFEQELASLETAAGIQIHSGRQHYLRFANPDTWRAWEQAGLRIDSTLGYPEAEGFRCGVCVDFPVFDVISRKMLQLRESPLIAMDVTLAIYQRYTPEQGIERLQMLRKAVERHQGDFTLLWHNSSWNMPFWAPWKSVFYEIVQP